MERIKKVLYLLFIVHIQMNCQNEQDDGFLNSDRSLKLEQQVIQAFFNKHGLAIQVIHTKNVEPYRIFLHEFNASEEQLEQIIKILKLDSVSATDFYNIHTDTLVNVDFRVYSSIGFDYLKNPLILFYKGEIDNKELQKELKVSKAYLYYNKKTKEACFQVYHGWG